MLLCTHNPHPAFPAVTPWRTMASQEQVKNEPCTHSTCPAVLAATSAATNVHAEASQEEFNPNRCTCCYFCVLQRQVKEARAHAESQVQEVREQLASRTESSLQDMQTKMRAELAEKIQKLKKELEKEVGQDLLTQKVEEANNLLTEDVNREWTRYTKELEVVSATGLVNREWT
eukprot:scaffold48265_cov18-Tisochrysis_lutea.AAC.1